MTNWKRNITLFLTSQTISMFGSFLVQYAITWHITLTTQSGSMMTLAIICGFVPTFLLAPIAGVWADRYNRKMLIMMADGFIAFATLILAILFLMGYDDLWLLFVISAIRAVGSGIQTPAVGAILPQIVPESALMKVNGINSSILSFIMIVSPMASGALLSYATIEAIFFIDVITATMAILTLFLFLRIPTHDRAATSHQGGYFTDIKLGYNYIRNHPFLKSFFAFIAFFMIFAAPASFLTPLQVTRMFGDDVFYLTAIEIAFAIGMLIGGVLIGVWGGFQRKVYTMTLATFVFGACTLAFGFIPNFPLYLFVMAVCGVAMPLFNAPSTVLLQEKVDPHYLGRVFGVMSMISTSVMPLGMLIFGPLADAVPIQWLFIGTGILLLLQCAFLVRSKMDEAV